MTAVRLTRLDHAAEELRGLAAKSTGGAQVRRLSALALVLAGQPRHAAAERSGMDRQTLRDWVHRYNGQGLGGLYSIRSGGRRASLTDAQMAESRELTIKGPDPGTDRVERWRRVDLREAVSRRFSVKLREVAGFV